MEDSRETELVVVVVESLFDKARTRVQNSLYDSVLNACAYSSRTSTSDCCWLCVLAFDAAFINSTRLVKMIDFDLFYFIFLKIDFALLYACLLPKLLSIVLSL